MKQHPDVFSVSQNTLSDYAQTMVLLADWHQQLSDGNWQNVAARPARSRGVGR